MELSRRNLLLSTAAAALGFTLPLHSLKAENLSVWDRVKDVLNPDKDWRLGILLENLRREIDIKRHHNPNVTDVLEACIPVNASIYRQLLLPRLLPVEPMDARVMRIGSRDVQAETRRLGAMWTFDPHQTHDPSDPLSQPDFSKVDRRVELLAAVSQEIVSEINSEHLDYMRKNAGMVTPPEASFETSLEGAVEAHRADWVIVTPVHLTKLGLSAPSGTDGVYGRVGQLGKATLYVDPYSDDDVMPLMGRNVAGSLTWRPYILAITHGVMIHPASFEPVSSFFHRYSMLSDSNLMEQNFKNVAI